MSNKGFVSLLPLIVAVGVLLFAAILFRVSQQNPNLGLPSQTWQQQVLSSSEKDSDSSGSSGSGSSGSSGSGSSDSDDSSGTSGSGGGSETPKPSPTPKPEDQKTEITTEAGIRIKTETKKDGQVRTEIRFGEAEKIKTRVEEGRTRIDVVSGGVKVRLERRDDRVVIKVKTQAGEEHEVGEDELVQIKQRLGQIKIATAGAKLAVITSGIPATTDFPLRIDLATNALTLVTPAGEKTVTILPDVAVQNLIAANVIDRLTGSTLAANVATRSALTSISQIINLGLEQGVPVYGIVGLKDHRLLGIIPVTTTVDVRVSAQDGQVLGASQSLIDRLIDFFSIAQ